MEIAFFMIGRNLVVDIKGEIDHHTSAQIREKIDRQYQRDRALNIIFNFENINFMDSSGIGVLMGRYKNVTSQGGEVAMYGATDQIDKVLTISGIYKIIKNYTSIDEAIKNLA